MNPAKHPNVQLISVNRKGVQKLLNDIYPYTTTGPDAIPGRLLKSLSEKWQTYWQWIFKHLLYHKTGGRRLSHQWSSRATDTNHQITGLYLWHQYAARYWNTLCTATWSLIKHLDDHHLLNDAQHDFRKRCSCESQLILTVQYLAKGLNDGEQIDAVLLDFSKAFDKVPHQRLLEKRRHYDIRDSLNKWIADFLTDRKQEVVIEGTHYNATNVTYGIPQGTVLGSLLFLVYINDMPEKKISSTTRLFADDSLVYRIIRSKEDQSLLQQYLDKLQ